MYQDSEKNDTEKEFAVFFQTVSKEPSRRELEDEISNALSERDVTISPSSKNKKKGPRKEKEEAEIDWGKAEKKRSTRKKRKKDQ